MELLIPSKPEKPTLEELLRKPDVFDVFGSETQEAMRRSDEFLAERVRELEQRGVFVI